MLIAALLTASAAAQDAAPWVEARLATVPSGVTIAAAPEPRTNGGAFRRRAAVRWSPDGRRVAYAGWRGNAWLPVVGDAPSEETYDFVSAPRFGGEHVFFQVARAKSASEGECWLWIDGERVGPEDWMGEFAVSPDGTRAAFWTQPGARYGNEVAPTAAKYHFALVREVRRDTWRGAHSRTSWVSCAAPAPRFLDDGETVVTSAMKRSGWVVLSTKGNRERERSDAVTALEDFSVSADGKRLAVLFEDGSEPGLRMTFREREVGATYDRLAYPTVEPRGRHVAFVAGVEGGLTVAVDDEDGPLPPRGDHVLELAFDPAAQRVAFVAVIGGREPEETPGWVEGGAWFVCVRPVEGDAEWTEEQRFLEVRDLTWDASGEQLAYAARREDGWRVVVGARESPPFDDVGEPRFAPDGRSVGFGARSGDELWWRVLPLE